MKERDIVKYKGALGRVIIGQYDKKGEYLFYPAGNRSYWERALATITEDDVTEATLEEKIVYLKMGFHWGTVKSVEIINKGEYVVFESDESMFHSYLNFEDICKGSRTLDGAIINLLAHKYDGCNSHAGYLIERMLQMDKKKAETE